MSPPCCGSLRCDKALDMRQYCRIFLQIAGCAVFGSWSVSAQPVPAQRPPEVHTRLTADTVLIGDQFFLEVDIDKDVAQEIQLPQFEQNRLTQQIELLGIEGVDTLGREGRRVKMRITYRLTSFDEGRHALGGFPIVWSASAGDAQAGRGDTVVAPELLQLAVGTFEIDTLKQQIFDIKRPINTPLIFDEIKAYVYWGAAAAAVLAALIYLLLRYWHRRSGHGGQAKQVPPHVAAIRALERLHSRKLWQNGKHKEYYSQLADIVRVYIDGRYGIGAMEMTSDQILEAMHGVNDDRLCGKLRELFSLADLVKFAKLAPAPEDNEQAYFDAYFYIEETKEIPEPGQEPLAPGATATGTGSMPADELTGRDGAENEQGEDSES